jgi:xanthine dehydrogenase accessory factor
LNIFVAHDSLKINLSDTDPKLFIQSCPGKMKNICLQVLDLKSSDSSLVLATVVRTLGSTPQKPGSSALFGNQGLISGTIGGGIVEGKVQQLSSEVILSKNSGLYHFNLDNDISNTAEAICGGRISVLVDANPGRHHMIFEQLRNTLSENKPGVLITKVITSEGNSVSIERSWATEELIPSADPDFQEKIQSAVNKLISERNAGGFAEQGNEIKGEGLEILFFLQPFFPPDQLVIAGAGHIGRALAHLGRLLDFEVTVIDDRSEFANSGNIPDAEKIIVKDIGEAMDGMKTGKNTYVVIVTRGHKDDSAALKPCFGRDVAYIGMIGSRTKIAAMRQKFLDKCWATSDQWDQIHAPVGLQIKSQTVEEIAVSIAAELVMVRNSKR